MEYVCRRNPGVGTDRKSKAGLVSRIIAFKQKQKARLERAFFWASCKARSRGDKARSRGDTRQGAGATQGKEQGRSHKKARTKRAFLLDHKDRGGSCVIAIVAVTIWLAVHASRPSYRLLGSPIPENLANGPDISRRFHRNEPDRLRSIAPQPAPRPVPPAHSHAPVHRLPWHC